MKSSVKHGECEKIQGYKTCKNLKKKELFGVRIKLLLQKVFPRKFTGNRNERLRQL